MTYINLYFIMGFSMFVTVLLLQGKDIYRVAESKAKDGYFEECTPDAVRGIFCVMCIFLFFESTLLWPIVLYRGIKNLRKGWVLRRLQKKRLADLKKELEGLGHTVLFVRLSIEDYNTFLKELTSESQEGGRHEIAEEAIQKILDHEI